MNGRNLLFRFKIKILIAVLLSAVIMCGCSFKGDRYNYQAAVNKFFAKDYSKALEKINKAISQNDSKTEYRILQSQILHKLDKNEEALKAIENSISNNNDDINKENNKHIYRTRAIIYIAMKDMKNALENVDKAIEIKNASELNKDLELHKIHILFELKEVDKVKKAASNYVGKYKDSEDVGVAYTYLGRITDKLKEADVFFDEAIKNKEYSAYYYKALRYKEEKDYAKASDFLEEYVKNNAANKDYVLLKQVDILIEAGLKTSEKRYFEQAKEIIKSGMSLKNDKISVLFCKKNITLLERNGKYEEAYVAAQELIERVPEDEALKKEIDFLESRVTKN